NISVFSPFSGMNTLERHFISKDSATQRAGRAGRLSSGKAYHIWHKSKILLQHDTAEILQADLTQMVLELALWGNDDITALTWLNLPPSTALAHAKLLLIQLGALDKKACITAHGKAMSRFGLHPRLAHMVLKAQELECSYEASLLAVLITEKDIYRDGRNNSDIKERIQVLHDVAQGKSVHAKYVDLKQCRIILTHAKRIEKVQKTNLNAEILGVLLAFAYPDRIALLRHANRGTYLLSNGKGAMLHNDDELFNTQFLVISDLNAKTTNAFIHKAIELNRNEIETHLKEQIEERDAVTWNEEFQRVEVRKISCLGAIVLKEVQVRTTQSDEVIEVLLDELEALGLEVLNWSKEALALKSRVNFVNHHGKDFPNFSSQYLLENMDEWLAPYLAGISTLKACKNLDLHNILLGQLSFKQTQELDFLAPAKQKVASGSHVTIDYANPTQPILAARLQEMFGTKETPKVMQGEVPLMIHLLSPAMRPMQITQDLESFWNNSYSDVKKELRGKYKKHYWPDNPLEATATSRTKRFM
ncbi:MAG: ATP-dependent helicase C-terminal domain-containing protein, partial [Campylobacterota bacterium]|nr:ATP-dependent helicase C-terminal domain-containing protein [Campylobacterota bacterium]